MTSVIGNIVQSSCTEIKSERHPELVSGSTPPLKRGELGLFDGRGMFRYKTRVNNASFLMKQSGIQESLSNTKIPACAGMTAIKLAELNHLEI